jgi:thioredoxin 1
MMNFRVISLLSLLFINVGNVMAVVAVNKDNYKQEIADETKPIILDVYATWCGPCQQMAPIFEELDKELGSTYKFAKLNVDESRELAIMYGVTAIPTFVFIKNNEVLAKETGFIAKDDLVGKIKAVFE